MIFITYQLDSLSVEAIRVANERYRKVCGLDVRELRVLRCIDDNPDITPGGLLALTYLEKSLISKILGILVKLDLVQRAVNARDARQFNLNVTAAGHALRLRADKFGDELEEQLLSPLEPAERKALSQSLGTLIAWVKQGGLTDKP